MKTLVKIMSGCWAGLAFILVILIIGTAGAVENDAITIAQGVKDFALEMLGLIMCTLLSRVFALKAGEEE